MADHQYETHADHEPDTQECRQICDGGLGVCKVCGCFEGSLATECPREKVGMDQQDLIYRGLIDFTAERGWHDTSGAGAGSGFGS